MGRCKSNMLKLKYSDADTICDCGVLGQIPPGQVPPPNIYLLDNNPPVRNTPGHIPTTQKKLWNNGNKIINIGKLKCMS